MNSSILLVSPAFVILFKWTALLSLGWCAHWLLRRRHARWRLILWRSLLCFGLVLPLLQFTGMPGIKIPVIGGQIPQEDLAGPPEQVAASKSAQAGTELISAKTPAATQTVSSAEYPNLPGLQRPVSWGKILASMWALGFAFATARLVWLQLTLSRLRREARPPTPAVQFLAREVQTGLGIGQRVEILTTDAIKSPFVCGLIKPAVMLPQALAQDLAPGELRALLNHEMAHVRQHDLAWTVAWQWMKVACWFHPLTWRVPSVHNLACEQEADRIASGHMTDEDSYAQLLARLALRVLALPVVETRLTVNGSSQIAKRLKLLGQNGVGAWNWRHSVAAFAITCLLFLVTAGCEFAKTGSANSASPADASKVEFKKVLVVVQDSEGKPVAGATILPTGFRVKGIHGADAYGWNTKLFGPAEKAVTDGEGKALVRYPVESIPEEKEFTRALIFKVDHPDYASVFIQTYEVDSPEQPIRLTRGIYLKISAYYGSDHRSVTDLVPILTEGVSPKDWQKRDDGCWEFRKLSPGGHLLQVMGRLTSGEIVCSEASPFTAQPGKQLVLYLEMKPGIRLEGRLDDNVPRPVKNGRVMLDVRPKEYPVLDVIEDYYAADEKYGGRHFWHSYRPINEDGSFVFESLPPGAADISVLGDGFTIKTTGQLQNRVNGALVKGPATAIAQAFPLSAPVTKVEVATEPTATLEFTASTKSGKPIAGVWLGMYPSVFRMWGMAGWQKDSSETAYRDIPPLADLSFSGKTDESGRLVIQNVPAETRSLDLDSPQYQVSIQQPNGWRDRHVRVSFEPGATNKLAMTLEPKGADYLGTAK